MGKSIAFHRFFFIPKFYDKNTGELVTRDFLPVFRKAIEWAYGSTGNSFEDRNIEEMVEQARRRARQHDDASLINPSLGGTGLLKDRNGKVGAYVEAHLFEDYWFLELAIDIEFDESSQISPIYEKIKAFDVPEHCEDQCLIQVLGAEPAEILDVLNAGNWRPVEFDRFDIYWNGERLDRFMVFHRGDIPNLKMLKLGFIDFFTAKLRFDEVWESYRKERAELINHQEELRSRLKSFEEGGECFRAMTGEELTMQVKVEKLDQCLDKLLKAYQPARERLSKINESLHSLEIDFDALEIAIKRIHIDAISQSPFRDLILTCEAHLEQVRSDFSRHTNILGLAEQLFGVISTEVQIVRQKLEHEEQEQERRFSRAVEIVATVLGALGIGEIFGYQSARAVYEILRPHYFPAFVSGDPLWDLEALAIRIAAAAIMGFFVAWGLEKFMPSEHTEQKQNTEQ